MSANPQDWNIQSRGEACCQTGEPFQDGQTIVSRLVYRQGEGYIREDYSTAAWDALSDPSGISVWHTVYRLPPPPREEPLKKETAESLLRKLIEQEDETNPNAIFILAVMLERKRILAEREVQEQPDGLKIRVYEHKKTGETFIVPDPGLKLSDLEAVQDEVVVLLGGKSRRAGEPEAPPEETTPEESPG